LQVRAVFIENISDPRLIERIAQEAQLDSRRNPVFRRTVRAGHRGGYLPETYPPQRQSARPRLAAAPARHSGSALTKKILNALTGESGIAGNDRSATPMLLSENVPNMIHVEAR